MPARKLRIRSARYNQPAIRQTTQQLKPSTYAEGGNILWRWNKTDVLQFGPGSIPTSQGGYAIPNSTGIANFVTNFDPVAPNGNNKNPTNGGRFSVAATYESAGASSTYAGPAVIFTGTATNGPGAPTIIPANNLGGCCAVIINDFLNIPTRFQLDYTLLAQTPTSAATGWGFGIVTTGVNGVFGYIHQTSTASVIMLNYNTTNSAGTYWPWVGTANTRTLATVAQAPASAGAYGNRYTSIFDISYSSTGTPTGNIYPTCPTQATASAIGNAVIPVRGATATMLGSAAGTGWTGATASYLCLICRFTGTQSVIGHMTDLVVSKHPLDRT